MSLTHTRWQTHTNTAVGSQCVSDPDIWHLSRQGASSFFPLILSSNREKSRMEWGRKEGEGQQKRERWIGHNDDPENKITETEDKQRGWWEKVEKRWRNMGRKKTGKWAGEIWRGAEAGEESDYKRQVKLPSGSFVLWFQAGQVLWLCCVCLISHMPYTFFCCTLSWITLIN